MIIFVAFVVVVVVAGSIRNMHEWFVHFTKKLSTVVSVERNKKNKRTQTH